MMKFFPLLIVSFILFTSCATIFSGSTKSVTFNTNVAQPVSINIDGVVYNNINLPAVLPVKRGFSPSRVEATSAGYNPITQQIDKRFNPISVINLGNIFGWVIDVVSGSVTTTLFGNYTLYFNEIKGMGM